MHLVMLDYLTTLHVKVRKPLRDTNRFGPERSEVPYE